MTPNSPSTMSTPATPTTLYQQKVTATTSDSKCPVQHTTPSGTPTESLRSDTSGQGSASKAEVEDSSLPGAPTKASTLSLHIDLSVPNSPTKLSETSSPTGLSAPFTPTKRKADESTQVLSGKKKARLAVTSPPRPPNSPIIPENAFIWSKETDSPPGSPTSTVSSKSPDNKTTFIIKVGDEDGQEVYATYGLLKGAPMLKDMCATNWKEGQTRIIRLPEMNPKAFEAVLNGLTNFGLLEAVARGWLEENPDGHNEFAEAYQAADYLRFYTMKDRLVKYLREEVLGEDFLLWLAAAFQLVRDDDEGLKPLLASHLPNNISAVSTQRTNLMEPYVREGGHFAIKLYQGMKHLLVRYRKGHENDTKTIDERTEEVAEMKFHLREKKKEADKANAKADRLEKVNTDLRDLHDVYMQDGTQAGEALEDLKDQLNRYIEEGTDCDQAWADCREAEFARDLARWKYHKTAKTNKRLKKLADSQHEDIENLKYLLDDARDKGKAAQELLTKLKYGQTSVGDLAGKKLDFITEEEAWDQYRPDDDYDPYEVESDVSDGWREAGNELAGSPGHMTP